MNLKKTKIIDVKCQMFSKNNNYQAFAAFKKDPYKNKSQPPVLLAKNRIGNMNNINELKESYTLLGHSIKVAEGSRQLLEQFNVTLSQKQLNLLLKHIVFLSTLFHDFGKACKGFQIMISNQDVYHWPPEIGGYRHEVISLLVASQNINVKGIQTILQKVQETNIHPQDMKIIILFSIISHHRSFKRDTNNNIRVIDYNQWPFTQTTKEMYNELLENKEKLQQVWKKLKEYLKTKPETREYFSLHVLPEHLVLNPYETLQQYLQETINKQDKSALFQDNPRYLPLGYKKGRCNPDQVTKIPVKHRLLMSLTRGLTIGADHLMSGEISINTIPLLKNYTILNPKHLPRAFQETLKKTKGNVMLRAPTGSGKTEAALFWAQNNQKIDKQGKPISRLFYVLPHTASINAMFLRLSTIFREKTLWHAIKHRKDLQTQNNNKPLVGLQHSKAAIALYSIIETEQYGGAFPSRNKDKKTQKIAYSLTKLTQEIYYPVKVSTPHQLLRVFLQGKGWETQTIEFFNGIFIFDEIHAYDPSLTGLIIGMAQVLTKPPYNATILFMSATFPSFLQKLLKENVDQSMDIIELNPKDETDRIILQTTKHHITITDQSIIQTINNKSDQEFLSRESTVIIVNTVKTAQTIYTSLKSRLKDKAQVQLFHSRYKEKDRRKIEEQIRRITNNPTSKPYILIATQVIEVSLDIDFEYGIIEISPLDSLVQRLGRINRRGKRSITQPNCLITKPEKNSRYVYKKRLEESYNLLEKWIKNHNPPLLTEQDKIILVETLYQNNPWDNEEQQEFKNTMKNPIIQHFLDNIIPGTYREWVEDIIEQHQNNSEVILKEDQEIVKKLLKKKEHLKILGYTIPIRISKQQKHQCLDWSEYPKIPFPILKKTCYEYDKERGLRKNNKR